MKNEFKDIIFDGKKVGKIGFSIYDDINAIGFGSFEIFPKFRRKGYAKKYLKNFIKKNKDKYDLIYCYVDKDNIPAIKLYKSLNGKFSKETNKKNQYEVRFYEKNKIFNY